MIILLGNTSEHQIVAEDNSHYLKQGNICFEIFSRVVVFFIALPQ